MVGQSVTSPHSSRRLEPAAARWPPATTPLGGYRSRLASPACAAAAPAAAAIHHLAIAAHRATFDRPPRGPLGLARASAGWTPDDLSGGSRRLRPVHHPRTNQRHLASAVGEGEPQEPTAAAPGRAPLLAVEQGLKAMVAAEAVAVALMARCEMAAVACPVAAHWQLLQETEHDGTARGVSAEAWAGAPVRPMAQPQARPSSAHPVCCLSCGLARRVHEHGPSPRGHHPEVLPQPPFGCS